jgi:S-(hydroxymethyl)glutathione dehydrogenase/alcohol dehydrogenase
VPAGFDYAFECVGHPSLIRRAIDMLGTGGSCVLLGVPKLGTEASFVVGNLYNDRSIMGCRYGQTRPHHDVPLITRFYLDGRFMLDEMVSRTYDLGDIERALADLEAGMLNRGVLTLT